MKTWQINLIFCFLILFPLTILIVSSHNIVIADVPGGGGNGGGSGVYTETWTGSTIEETSESQSEQTTDSSTSEGKVKSEDMVIALVIGGISILIGKGVVILQKPNKRPIVYDHVPDDELIFASDFLRADYLPEEFRKKIKTYVDIHTHNPKQINDAIEQMRRSGYTPDRITAAEIDFRIRIMKKAPELWKDPDLDAALAKMFSEGWNKVPREDIHINEVKEHLKEVKDLKKQLQNSQWCPKCDRAVSPNEKLTPVPESSRSNKIFIHHQRSNARTPHDSLICRPKFVYRNNDVYTPRGSAWAHQKKKWGLPHPSTHIKCLGCDFYHKRDDAKPSWIEGVKPRFLFPKSKQTLKQVFSDKAWNNYTCPDCKAVQSYPDPDKFIPKVGYRGGIYRR